MQKLKQIMLDFFKIMLYNARNKKAEQAEGRLKICTNAVSLI